MSDDTLLFEVTADGIAVITLNRPDKLNAFTTEMLLAWGDCLLEAQAREDVKVVILTGSGRGFCSGGDLGRFADKAKETAWRRKNDLECRVHRIPLIMETMDKPVIAAVNGVATGAGMDMALMCDMRIAAASARFAETYVRAGIFAGDGGAWYLPRLIGPAKAMELLLSARFVNADEAERIGLVNRVVPDEQLLEETLAFARQIAAQPPLAVRMMKRAVRQGMSQDLRSHLDMASSHMAVLYSTADHAEALAALAQKRPGRFEGE